MTECNKCSIKTKCPFYEENAEECVYDAMAQYAEWSGEQMKKEAEQNLAEIKKANTLEINEVKEG